MIKLNETPVRTARNFNINNIEIEESEIQNRIEQFDSIDINLPEGVLAEKNVSTSNFKYGVSENILSEVRDDANNKLKLTILENIKDPITIFCEFDDENKTLIQDIEVVAKKGCKADLIIKYKSEDLSKCYHNSSIRVKLEEDSNINMTVINLLNTKSTNFLSIENELDKNSVLNYLIVDFGGKNSITNYYSNLMR